MFVSSIEVQDLPDQTVLQPSPSHPQVAAAHGHDRIFRFGRCEISLARREILVGGEPQALQPQPFDVLLYLIEHRERVVRTEELLDRLWADAIVQPGTVASTLARIRKVIAQGSDIEVIRTYHRVGYRFVAPLLPG
jgi:DNA-binding winged helix-turn-helix (wHTH) protein